MASTVIAVVDDLFFASKIRGTAEQVGASVSFPRSIESVIAAAVTNPPSLIICDLNSQRINPLELAQTLKANGQTGKINLLGFFSHVQTELQREAVKAGYDRVLPRSLFAAQLREILIGD